MTPAPQILIADDHPLFREAMAQVIAMELPGSTLVEADSLASTLEAIGAHPGLDLILLDLNMPGMAGLEGLRKVRRQAPELAVVMISAEEDKQLVLQAIQEGATGFITKSSPRERMRQALIQVLAGNIYLPPDIIRGAPSAPGSTARKTSISEESLQSLTERQRRVLERMALGESNKQIAWQLKITETTVKTHVSAILGKLGVHNRVQAVIAAGEQLAENGRKDR